MNTNFKNYWMLFILTFLHYGLVAQSSLINPVIPIAQKASNWCWAASLEMVIKHYQPASDITQCSLAMFNIRNSGSNIKICCSNSHCSECQSSSMTCLDCADCRNCGSCNVTSMKTHGDCNQLISSNTRINALKKYQKIIGKTGFNASYINSRLYLYQIEDEINLCQRPLITIYKNFSHAATVVGTTYTPTDSFVIALNPKHAPCMVARNDINYNEQAPEVPNAFMYNIYPKDTDNPCIPTGVRRMQLRKATNSIIPNSIVGDTIENGIYRRLTNQELQKIIDSHKYYPVVTRYISTDKLKTIAANELSITNSTISDDMIELISESNPRTATILKRRNNVWIPIKISPYYQENDIIVNFNDSTLTQSNSDKNLKKICDNGTYEHIRYFELGYDFYRFCINGIYYLMPFYDYDDFKNIYFVNNKLDVPISKRIFLQNDILKLLKKITLSNL